MFAGAAQAKQQPVQTAEYTLYEAIVKGLRETERKSSKRAACRKAAA